MGANKPTSISGATSYREIGEFWDQHDLADYESETREVEIEVDIQSSVFYFAMERSLAEKLRSVAQNHGVSAESMLNDWVEQHVAAEIPPK